jgi:ATP-dependent RNA helicase DeaD
MSDLQVLPAFAALGLSAPLLSALKTIGYETPSPIQSACIPFLMQGRDVLGQAQTGTGKTAAFALPLLERIDPRSRLTQVLVLAPTRELAIQVAEACQSYAANLGDFHVLPIYGGQSYGIQLKQLQRGVQMVVGTPGRVLDHIRRGTLKIDNLKALVLDEADEMLRMGFIDDVEWVMQQIPKQTQIALFSATMPKEIRKVAQQHLKSPEEIKIQSVTTTAATIKQRFILTNNDQKIEVLTRLLEVRSIEGMIVFVRTKTATTELADKLNARGFNAAALNGDIPQDRRERVITQLKNGQLDILVATDVAARGLDVDRITLVINYDIPYDTEAYVHRIGRTGRAGREGEAILFITNRERRLLGSIEKATKQPIEQMSVPGLNEIYARRRTKFKQQLSGALEDADLESYKVLLEEFRVESGRELTDIAAALAYLVQGKESALFNTPGTRDVLDQPERKSEFSKRGDRPEREERGPREFRESREGREPRERTFKEPRDRGAKGNKTLEYNPLPLRDYPDVEMERYRIAVGYDHGASPGNIVGAIANEGEIESCYIGHIEMFNDFSTVDLPKGMPKETFHALQNARVFKHKLELKKLSPSTGSDDMNGPAALSYTEGKKDRSERKGSENRPRKGANAKGSFDRKPGSFDKKPKGEGRTDKAKSSSFDGTENKRPRKRQI